MSRCAYNGSHRSGPPGRPPKIGLSRRLGTPDGKLATCPAGGTARYALVHRIAPGSARAIPLGVVTPHRLRPGNRAKAVKPPLSVRTVRGIGETQSVCP